MVSNLTTRCAFSAGSDAGQAVEALADMLAGEGKRGTLGFVYVTDSFKARLPSVAERLRELTGVEDWVGTVGFGVMGGSRAAFDQPAISAMIVDWPKPHYKLFQGVPAEARSSEGDGPLGGMATALVHADPRNPRYPDLLKSLSAVSGAYLSGGVTASRSGYFDQMAGISTDGGISGVLAGPAINMSIGVSQGCTRAGPVRTITAGERNIIAALDGMPALDALFRDLGVAGAGDIDALYSALENLHVSLMVPNCDTGDYLVRNLTGIDTETGVIALGDFVAPGMKAFFSRRDQKAAVEDLKAMVRKARSRLETVSGALYFSCCGRGPHMFESAGQEAGYVQEILGGVPLAGFYANGEIAGERIYGFTGVLTLF